VESHGFNFQHFQEKYNSVLVALVCLGSYNKIAWIDVVTDIISKHLGDWESKIKMSDKLVPRKVSSCIHTRWREKDRRRAKTEERRVKERGSIHRQVALPLPFSTGD
jgi:hypothetical protein